MKPLEMPDVHHVAAAVGWLELGSWQDAEAELEMVAPDLRGHPHVQQVRMEVFAKAGKWKLAADIAKFLRATSPDEPHFWISLAYATRRMPDGGLDSAKGILTEARERFPQEPIIAYNLACYECQLGRTDSARTWFQAALGLGDAKALKQMALADDDLQSLWAEIRKM